MQLCPDRFLADTCLLFHQSRRSCEPVAKKKCFKKIKHRRDLNPGLQHAYRPPKSVHSQTFGPGDLNHFPCIINNFKQGYSSDTRCVPLPSICPLQIRHHLWNSCYLQTGLECPSGCAQALHVNKHDTGKTDDHPFEHYIGGIGGFRDEGLQHT